MEIKIVKLETWKWEEGSGLKTWEPEWTFDIVSNPLL